MSTAARTWGPGKGRKGMGGRATLRGAKQSPHAVCHPGKWDSQVAQNLLSRLTGHSGPPRWTPCRHCKESSSQSTELLENVTSANSVTELPTRSPDPGAAPGLLRSQPRSPGAARPTCRGR